MGEPPATRTPDGPRGRAPRPPLPVPQTGFGRGRWAGGGCTLPPPPNTTDGNQPPGEGAPGPSPCYHGPTIATHAWGCVQGSEPGPGPGRIAPVAARTTHQGTRRACQGAGCSLFAHTLLRHITPLPASPIDLSQVTSHPDPQNPASLKPPCLCRAAPNAPHGTSYHFYHFTSRELCTFAPPGCGGCTFIILYQNRLAFTVPPPYIWSVSCN